MSGKEREREPEKVQDREIKWDKSAKGKGNRWRMLRDIVALLSLTWMNLTMIQDTMLRHRGLSRSKVVEMLDQLERSGDIKPVSGKIGENVIMGWSTTDQGVSFWIGGTRRNIPVSVARVVPIIKNVRQLEE